MLFRSPEEKIKQLEEETRRKEVEWEKQLWTKSFIAEDAKHKLTQTAKGYEATLEEIREL